MINIKFFLKNFGLLELLVFSSFIYVLSMLIWTATTRSAVESRANAIIENHSVITDIINEEVMKCDQNPNQKRLGVRIVALNGLQIK